MGNCCFLALERLDTSHNLDSTSVKDVPELEEDDQMNSMPNSSELEPEEEGPIDEEDEDTLLSTEKTGKWTAPLTLNQIKEAEIDIAKLLRPVATKVRQKVRL